MTTPTTEAGRLPMPNDGLTYEVQAEHDWFLVGDGRLCEAKPWHCEDAVAARRDGRHASCEAHLRKGLMWIENGQVVSWAVIR